MRISWLLMVALVACSDQKPKIKQPNILLVVADDLGYSDLGILGSEIATPHLDRLAREGLLFTNFHTAPSCAPSRAMILSGNDNHVAGMGIQGFTGESWGYEGHLTDRVTLIPQLLQEAGYHTYITGKWHLGLKPEHNPAAKGFERSYTLLEGAGNHYNGQNLFNDSLSHYTQDGIPIEWEDGAYATDVYTNKMLEFIEQNKDDDRPFFGFLAYTTPHWPLQVDSSYWMPYQGVYDSGYEALRAARLQNLKDQGVVAPEVELPPLHPKVRPWDSLLPDEQKIEARKMELYAGMVTNLDDHIAQIVEYLEKAGLSDNTYVVFMSDNGAAANDFYYDSVANESYLHPYFTNSYENMGQPDSYISYGPQWAEAGTAAFNYFKGYTTEGGTRAPMFVFGPGVARGRTATFTSLLDLAPTIYEWAGVPYPENEPYPLPGESLQAVISGKSKQAHNPDYVFRVEQHGDVQIRKGPWKLVHSGYPIDESNFRLYNLDLDPAESKDLRASHPDEFNALMQLWQKYVLDSQIITEEIVN